MWLKKISHKKMQMFLVGLVLFATTALFTMCIDFTQELTSFSRRGITKDNCPDIYIFDTGSDQLKDNIKDTTIRDSIKGVTSIKGKTVTAPVMYNGKDISLYYDSLLDAEQYKKFGYIDSEDENQKLPQKGEIWLAKTVAEPNHIEIGDTITLQYDTHKDLKVVGLFTSTYLPKSMAITPMLGNIKDINELENSEPAALHAIAMKNLTVDTASKLYDADPYMKMGLTRDSVQESLTEVSTMMGGLGSAAGIIVFIVALVIIRFIIRTNLLKEYKAIGIYKSLGYTAGKIRAFYLKGYMLVGFIGITLGAFSSLLLVYPIGLICTRYVPGFSISGTSIIICAIVIVLLSVLLYLNLLLALKKVKKITPVEAIAVGITSKETKIKRSVIRSAKSSFAMAINEMFKYKKSTIMMMLVLSVSLYLSMVFVMGYSSSVHMADKANMWFGIPQKDTYIAGNINDELRNYIKNDSYVKSSVYGECIYLPEDVKFDGKNGNEVKEITYMSFIILDNLDHDNTGVDMYEGYAPKHAGEIALTRGMLQALNLKVGDYTKVSIDGSEKDYFITGSYESMMNSGFGAMMLEKDMKECASDYKATRGYIRLNSIDDYDAFKKDVEKKFPGVSVDRNWTAIENSVSSIERMLTAVSLILVIVFIVFAVLNTIIVITMDLKNWRRRYGIQKSLGFTTGYMIRQNLWKYSIITSISVIVAAVMHKAISARFLGTMVIHAFRDNDQLLVILVVGFMAVSIGVSALLSLTIKKITPVDLMEE